MSNFHEDNSNNYNGYTNNTNYNGYPNNQNAPNSFPGSNGPQHGGNHNGRHNSNAVVIVSIALVMLILGGLLGVAIMQGMNTSQQAQLGSEATTTPVETAEPTAEPEATPEAQTVSGSATTSLAAFSEQIADVVESVQDSVVGIHNYQTVTTGGNYGGYFGGFYLPYYGGGENSEPQTTEQLAGSGSGVIYSSDGYVITNYHVIEG
ncbi:MAG: hypothetical protein ACOX83_04445, partial [Candidatus Spyradocola sp.]